MEKEWKYIEEGKGEEKGERREERGQRREGGGTDKQRVEFELTTFSELSVT